MSDSPVVDTFPGFLRGYRTWDTTAAGIYLGSVWAEYRYQAGRNQAYCRGRIAFAFIQGHPAPQRNCACGFYAAYKDIPREYRHHPIWGSVKATGRVLIGTRGFRAEKVEIEALCAGTEGFSFISEETIQRLGNHYSVPTFPSPEAMFKAFPPQSLDGLVPAAVPSEEWLVMLRFRGINGVDYAVKTNPDGSGGVVNGSDGWIMPLPPMNTVTMAGNNGTRYTFESDGVIEVSITHPMDFNFEERQV